MTAHLAVGVLALGLLASDGAAADEPHLDRYGDPLPASAVARLGTVRFRHGGNFNPAAEFLPDGKTIVTGTSDGRLRYWEAATGKLLQVFRACENESLLCMDIAQDGETIAVGGYKGASLWSVPGRTLLHNLDAGRVMSLAFSPDGTILVTGGDFREPIRIFDVASGKELRLLRWHADRVTRVLIAPDNCTLITVSKGECKVHVGDLRTGDIKFTIGDRAWRDLHAAELAPDGKSLALGGGPFATGFVEMYDLVHGKLMRSFDVGAKSILKVQFRAGGKELLAYSMDGTVRRWEVATGQALANLHGPKWWHRISPHGRTGLQLTGAGLAFYDVATGKAMHDFDAHIGRVAAVAFSEDGKLVASACEEVRLWDRTTSKIVRKLRGVPDWPEHTQSIATAPGGFLTNHSDGAARLWNAETGTLVREFRLKENRLNSWMTLAADGKRILCSSLGEPTRDKTIIVATFDIATGKELLRRELDKPGGYTAEAPVFSPDGRSYVRRADVGLSLTVLETGKELCRFLTPDIIDDPLVFAPDGRALALRSSSLHKNAQSAWRDQHQVRVFDVATGKEKYALPAAGYRLPLVFSASGRHLAIAGEQQVTVCDANSGKVLWRSPELEHRIHCVAFSPNGQELATGHAEGNVLIWDIARIATRRGQ